MGQAVSSHQQILADLLATIIPFLAKRFSNAIESMDMALRKVLTSDRALPTDAMALKPKYLAIQNVS